MTDFWTNYGFYLWLISIVLVCILTAICIYTVRQMKTLNTRYTSLLKDVDGGTLEDIWQARSAQVSAHETQLHSMQQELSHLREQTIQHIGLIRFNPFDDVGGDQSFAFAILNGERDGVVISSIYSRTGGRMYAKPINNGGHMRTLSTEEEMAIALALGQSEPVLSSSSSN